jgi:hypothetical protein
MTILGQHTVHELDDLVKALSYQVSQITTANLNCKGWPQRDPQGYANWADQLAKATTAWGDVVHSVMRRIELTPELTWDVVPAEGDFQAIAKAFEPFEDLTRTFMAQAQCAISFDKTPQPTAPDLDLTAYKVSDSAVKWVEKQEKAVTRKASVVLPLVAGGLGALAALLLALRRAVDR